MIESNPIDSTLAATRVDRWGWSSSKGSGLLPESQVALFACSEIPTQPWEFEHTITSLRTPGNSLCSLHTRGSAEAAVLEYAIQHQAVRDIVILGHVGCGVLGQLWCQRATPALQSVLEDARPLMADEWAFQTPSFARVVFGFVLSQLEEASRMSMLAEALQQGRARLHGWVLDEQRGKLFAYNPWLGCFVELSSAVDPWRMQRHRSL